MMPEIPAIEQLVPHSGPMLLLDQVLVSKADSVVCSLVVGTDGVFDTDGEVPALVGLEYMAQAIAAFSGLKAARRGAKPALGFLLGTRKFSSNVPAMPCGVSLRVTAHQVIKDTQGMAAFDCLLEGEGIQQSATLTVYEPTNPDKYLSGEAS